MDAKTVIRLLNRYFKTVQSSIKGIEKAKAKAEKAGLSEEVDLGDRLLAVGRLELEQINEAIEWLNDIQE